MAHIVPVREFETAADMQAHAAALRAKAFTPKPQPAPLPKPPLPKAEVAHEPEQPASPELTQRVDGLYSLKDMVRATAYCSGIRRHHLIGQSRLAEIVKARQIGFWLAHNFTGKSLPQIGGAFGGRHHTTALHGIRRVDAVIASADLSFVDDPLIMGFRLWGLSWPTPAKAPFTLARLGS